MENPERYVGWNHFAADGGEYGIYIVGLLPEKNDFVVMTTVRGKIRYDESPRRIDYFKASYRYRLVGLPVGCTRRAQMLKVELSRLESAHENLRTNTVLGETHSLPKVGEVFIMTGKSLTEGGLVRVVTTTPVKEILLHPKEGSMEFWTGNSHYGLQTLDTSREVPC